MKAESSIGEVVKWMWGVAGNSLNRIEINFTLKPVMKLGAASGGSHDEEFSNLRALSRL